MGGKVSEGMFSTLNLSYNRGDKKEAVDENFKELVKQSDLIIQNQYFQIRFMKQGFTKVTKRRLGKS